ncbi:MAG: hypothetical protein NT062_25545, partial [Proteobacteria bacterium]|nr:hypothetical protein [Pseudomonadota bacterium]
MFMDRALSQRLEGAEGAIGASFVDARQRVSPDAGARRQDFDGTIALYDGPASPMSQTFGLGLAQPATAAQLAAIEAFFDACGCTTQHEVSPLAGVETTALLVARGYRPIEMSTILVRPIVDDHLAEPIVVPRGLVVRRIDPRVDGARFIDASVRGWCDDPAQEAVIRPLATLGVANPTMTSFLVEADGGEVLATGSLGLHEGVALLAG